MCLVTSSLRTQDVFQSLEKLKATLLTQCAGARRLSEREKAEKALEDLQHSYEQSLKQAKNKQGRLESLLTLWRKCVHFIHPYIHLSIHYLVSLFNTI